jgi:hypothetical protein
MVSARFLVLNNAVNPDVGVTGDDVLVAPVAIADTTIDADAGADADDDADDDDDDDDNRLSAPACDMDSVVVVVVNERDVEGSRCPFCKSFPRAFSLCALE